ncbi:hypothetical protein ABUK73_06270 [Agrobacterium sp. BA1120]|uniref:hypothetical protein n=1 Tax=Agrobacterium sp. BA1120 TaxID=3228927 RepID=UPI00336A610C
MQTDAQAIASNTRNILIRPANPIGGRKHLGRHGIADLMSRKRSLKITPSFSRKFDCHAKKALTPDFPPLLETVLWRNIVCRKMDHAKSPESFRAISIGSRHCVAKRRRFRKKLEGLKVEMSGWFIMNDTAYAALILLF